MRLATCWAHIREFTINQCTQNNDDLKIVERDLPTKDEIIEKFDQKRVPASELLNGLKQAINDFSLGVQDGLRRNDTEMFDFLTRYKTATGREFLDDAGNAHKIAKKIVKRGTVANETEFYLLKELLTDGDQTVFSETQTIRANEMIEGFEFGDAK